MFALLDAYKKYDPAAKNRVEILFLYPGIRALAIYQVAHSLWRSRIPFIPRALSEFGRLISGIEIHPGARLGKEFIIDHGMGVVIGETAEVGDQVIIYQGVTLGGTSLDPVKRHPTIGNRVVIGAGAKILGNIHIGDDTRIGANSVVVDSVPSGSTVVGIPGRVIKRQIETGHELNHDYII